MNDWDPIGVSDTPEAADEYDSYIGDIYDLIQSNASAAQIAAYLRHVEIDQMGMVDAEGLPLLANEKRETAASSLKSLLAKE